MGADDRQIKNTSSLILNNFSPKATLLNINLLPLQKRKKKMEVIETAIQGAYIIEPRVFEDARGYFFESFSQREFDEKYIPSRSYKTMRVCHDME